ncbi:MAG: PHP domain-containing protein [Caldilineaceae bacterium]
MERLLYESHMHTPLCKHARGNPTEYAAVAWERGLKGIVVTCHNPPVDGWSPQVRMAEDQFDTYVELIEEARAQWAGRVDVRMGLECDFVPGMEQAIEAQLARATSTTCWQACIPSCATTRRASTPAIPSHSSTPTSSTWPWLPKPASSTPSPTPTW